MDQDWTRKALGSKPQELWWVDAKSMKEYNDELSGTFVRHLPK